VKKLTEMLRAVQCACGVTCQWCRRGAHGDCLTGLCKA
jgi:hypothetical protein